MPLTREQKEEVVAELEDKIGRQKSITFVDFQGFGVKEFTNLRRKLEEVGGEVKVAKKTLMDIAFDSAGIDMKDYEGQLALVFGYEDKIRPLKVVYNAQEETELDIVGGYFDEKFAEKEKIEKIAQLPSREELLGQFTRAVASPLSGLVNTLQGNIKGLVYTLKAIEAEQGN